MACQSNVVKSFQPSSTNDFSDLENFKPLIPFIKEYSYSTGGNTFSPIPSYTDPVKFSHWVMYNNLSTQAPYATYNIWNLVNSTGGALSTNVKLYEGPVGATVSGKSIPSIKTIRDGINGSKLFISSKGKGKSCIVKRVFPTSKDIIFQNPVIFYPTKVRDKVNNIKPLLTLNGETVTAAPSANTG